MLVGSKLAPGRAALVCVCLWLPYLVCSGSSPASALRHAAGFAAPPRAGLTGLRSAITPTACRPGGSRLGARLVTMQEDHDTGKLLGSRRLGQWAEGLGEEGQKVLWSRRLALKFHEAFMGGQGGESGEAVGEAVAEAEPVPVPEALEAEPVLLESKAEPEPVQQEVVLQAEEVVQETVQRADVQLASPGTQGGKQEWGEIMDVGSSPSRPDLPELTAEDEAKLLAGDRVQMQIRTGRVGTGMVVVDVQADIATVFAVLTDLERYPERISTVRRCTIYERGNKVCKAQFNLSRFMLEVNTVLRCERDQNTLRFELDKDRKPLAMEEAEGFWYLEEAAGRPGWTRIWLSAGITCSKLLPTFLVDYAAARALPRATTWLRPTIEAIALQLPPGAGNVRGAKAPKEGFVEVA